MAWNAISWLIDSLNEHIKLRKEVIRQYQFLKYM